MVHQRAIVDFYLKTDPESDVMPDDICILRETDGTYDQSNRGTSEHCQADPIKRQAILQILDMGGDDLRSIVLKGELILSTTSWTILHSMRSQPFLRKISHLPRNASIIA